MLAFTLLAGRPDGRSFHSLPLLPGLHLDGCVYIGTRTSTSASAWVLQLSKPTSLDCVAKGRITRVAATGPSRKTGPSADLTYRKRIKGVPKFESGTYLETLRGTCPQVGAGWSPFGRWSLASVLIRHLQDAPEADHLCTDTWSAMDVRCLRNTKVIRLKVLIF